MEATDGYEDMDTRFDILTVFLLQEPVLSESDVDQLSEGTDDPVSVVKRLKKVGHTI